jgi:hypothetical protein|nr:MAG TPA: hypothetical protein [Caudoviricetes sp.]
MNSVIRENFTKGKIYKAYSYIEFLNRIENIAKECGFYIGYVYKSSKYINVVLDSEGISTIDMKFNYYKYNDYYIYLLEVSNVE